MSESDFWGIKTSLTGTLSFPLPVNKAFSLGTMGGMGAVAAAAVAADMKPNCETKVTRSGRKNKISKGVREVGKGVFE